MVHMMKSMEAETACKLKQHLSDLAAKTSIDLKSPENRYTLWAENGPQGYLCWGRSSYPHEVYRLLGHYMLNGAVILEMNESGQRVILFTCEIG